MTNQCQHGQLARVCQICEQAAEIADLRAQVAALEVDAGRYRWLRNRACHGPHERFNAEYGWFDVSGQHEPGFDAAIDAALAARKGEA